MAARSKQSFEAQKITDSIARNNNLGRSSTDMYVNPLSLAAMEGDFFRGLMRSKKYAVIRKVFAIFFFIIPASIAILFFSTSLSEPKFEHIFSFLTVVFFSLLSLLAGVKIFRGS
jgi:hypothetical protein